MKVERYEQTAMSDKLYTLKTLYERKEEILDAKEKEYLSNVIRPFYVDYIMKRKTMVGCEYIEIKTYDVKRYHYTITYPNFIENTMYKNMESNKEYTLEELGL